MSSADRSADPRTEAWAQQLLHAWDACSQVPLPSADGVDNAQAYAIAERLRQLRVARGEAQRGWKIGFTNRSIWPRYGVHQPMWAPVWSSTLRVLDGAETRLSLAGLSQPRIEPEVVFGFAHAPRAGMRLAELQGCIAWVAHGFEIVHTHFEGWRFIAPDAAADFALHGRLLVGPRVAPWPTMAADLAAMRVALACDGQPTDEGIGSVVLDGPLQALQVMVESMAATTPHWRIAPGEVVTTGTITDAWPLQAGQRWHTTLSEPRLSSLTLSTEA
jgi:2-oxo-3-hexenedioate decarboxylase